MMMTTHNIKTRWDKACLVLMGLLLFTNIGFAQKIPARPNPPHLVNDFANILTDKQEHALEQKLVAYNDSTSTQICVVTVKSLGGTDSNDFAYQIGEKWGVGTKENNGVVILVKPKTADEQGDVSIQVGYGMEPYVTDAINYEIRTKVMIPAFKENNYYKGIDGAVDAIIALASGAFKGFKSYGNDDDEDDDGVGLIMIGVILLFIYIILRALGGKGNNGGGKGGFWRGLLWGILLSNTRRGGGGSWGGGGGSWGGSSGGFGGFGGGHFGGGGGSSKW